MHKEYILLNGFRKAKKDFTAGFHVPLNAYSTLYTNSIQSPQRHDNYAVIITNPQLGCMRADMIRLSRMV